MKILAIDTCTEICSVAILENNKILKKIDTKSEKEHSETLMPMLDNVFKELNMSLDDINLLACSKGPGSFTGIRVGMATIKGFADAKNIPVIGVNSLETLAYLGNMKMGDGEYVSLIDAKNDNVYFAIYKVKNGKVSIYKNPETLPISKIVNYIDNLKLPVYFVGNIDFNKLEPLYSARASIGQANSEEMCGYKYLHLDELESLAVGVAIAGKDKYENGIYRRFGQPNPNVFEKTSCTKAKRGNIRRHFNFRNDNYRFGKNKIGIQFIPKFMGL